MACSRPRPPEWICKQKYYNRSSELTWSSSSRRCCCYIKPNFFGVEVLNNYKGLTNASKERKGWLVNGGGRDGRWLRRVREAENGVSEEDKSFVEALREAQPYIFAHIGRTFVVVLSAEIVAGPCLDSTLKVRAT